MHAFFIGSATPYGTFTLDPAVTAQRPGHGVPQPGRVRPEPGRDHRVGATGTTTFHIQRTGILRVGYNPSVVPFCYLNDAGELVGYDVAYRL